MKDRKDGYGGVLVGIHSSVMNQEIDVDSEAELVAAKILCGKQNISIGAMYRPPRTKEAYMDSLIKLIEDICTSNPGAPI